MKTALRRRTCAAIAMATITGLTLVGCSADSGGDKGVELTMMAWANADEAEMYESILGVFEEKNPGVTVNLEYSDVGGYRDKLNTKFAAGTGPDVMFLVDSWIGEYTSRGALLDYAEYPEQIDFDGIDSTFIDAYTTEDGALYSIPTGSTAAGLAVNTAVLDQYGVALPDDAAWSWDDFAEWARSITEASGGAVHGSLFDLSWYPTFGAFVRQNGEDVYDQDGEYGVSEDTLTAWFERAVELHETQAFAPAESADATGAFSPEESPLGSGKVASTIIPANALGSYDAILGGKEVLLRIPGEADGVRLGQAVTPTLQWTSAATSKHPEQAAALVDFLTNDIDSYADRGTFLGVPVNAEVATELSPTLTPVEATFVDYVTDLAADDRDPLYPDPAGAGEVNDAMLAVMTEVTFGRLSPAEAATRMLSEADAILSRAS